MRYKCKVCNKEFESGLSEDICSVSCALKLHSEQPTSKNYNKLLGSVGELRVAEFLLNKGYPVFKDLSDSYPIDLIMVIGPYDIRIQVKTRTMDNGAIPFKPEFGGRGNNQSYSIDTVDLFAIYSWEKDLIAWIPAYKVLDPPRQLKLRIEEPKSNQNSGITWFSEYTDFERSIEELLIYKYGKRDLYDSIKKII